MGAPPAVNFRQLEFFLAVARSGSLTAAALELKVAQPTLTKSIHGLEHELGVKLFERLPRGVALTVFGAALRRHAERVGVQLGDAFEELRSMRGGAEGPVAIGAGPSWLRRLLPEAVAIALTASPALRISVLGGYDDVLLRDLRGGGLHFVVAELPSPENARDLDLMPLAADTLGVACRAGHPLAQAAGRLRPRDLIDYPWVMPPASTRAQQRLNALFVAADLPQPRIAAETESMAFLLRLVGRSDALTFTIFSTLDLPEAADLMMLDVPELASRREAGVITRRGGWLPPAALLIIDQLRLLCARTGRN
jgi:LysR family transcriptional regulator of gallate degradation